MTDTPNMPPTPDPSAPPPPAAPAAAPPSNLGKQRSPILIVLLSIVTFGIWLLVWSYQNGETRRTTRRSTA